MKDILASVLANADAFRWLFFIGLLWAFYRWMQGDDSEGVEWRDYVSAIGVDGKYHGDINKLGQLTGIVIGSVSLIMVSANAKGDMLGFAAVLTAYFAFVGCVAGYASYLRSKQNRTETVLVTEPAADPATTKITKTTTEPVKSEVKGTNERKNPLEGNMAG